MVPTLRRSRGASAGSRPGGFNFVELGGGDAMPRCPRDGEADDGARFPASLRLPPPARDAAAAVFDDCTAERRGFLTASGDVLCVCGHPYREHPDDPADDFLTVACDGRRLKL